MISRVTSHLPVEIGSWNNSQVACYLPGDDTVPVRALRREVKTGVTDYIEQEIHKEEAESQQ